MNLQTRILALGASLMLLMMMPAGSRAAGISVDSGLTPPEGRWIIRTQYRTMSREAPGPGTRMTMRRHVVPLVVIYGARPELTLGIRQTYEVRSTSMANMETDRSGLGDLTVFGKYKALRVNRRTYTLGIAPTVALKAPTGSDDITTDTWDLSAGAFLSWRSGPWGMDTDLRYVWNGFGGVSADETDPGDAVSLNLAVTRQFALGRSGRSAVAPVLELTWDHESRDSADGVAVANTGETVFAIAPGLKFTASDTILEVLLRIPVSQRQEGAQMEAREMVLVGVRRMF